MTSVTVAANHGVFGGGEVMLLRTAEAARELGLDVTVVAPAEPSDVVTAAAAAGFMTVPIPGDGPRGYLRGLRRWDARSRRGLLWCHGLRPAVATSGHRDRIVHLHQTPSTRQQPLAEVARAGALGTVVPSMSVSRQVRGSRAFPNWTEEAPRRRRSTGEVPVVGYLGRLSIDKGVPLLCEAIDAVRSRYGAVRLLLAGEIRFARRGDEEAVRSALAALGDVALLGGWMDRSDFFDRVDLAVVPSVAPESFGLSAAEAMAARCPLVVSDAGALPEVVGPDYAWTFPSGDVDALAATIADGLQFDWPDQVTESRDRWKMHFSPDAGRRRVADLLGELDIGRTA